MNNFIQITEILAYLPDAKFNGNTDAMQSPKDLQNALLNGYIILHAIPFSNEKVAGIKYILKSDE